MPHSRFVNKKQPFPLFRDLWFVWMHKIRHQTVRIKEIVHEPATVALMDEYLLANGYANDFTDKRFHHEIYLSDARKVAPEKWKTVIRHPIKNMR